MMKGESADSPTGKKMIPETMKALVVTGRNEYALQTIPVPELREGDMLIRVEACGICAGDIKASHGTSRFWGGDGMPSYCEPPFIPGHEFFGRVVAMKGSVPGDFRIGDRVISEQIVPCGECWYCRRGMHWLCDPHNVYGFKARLNGGMAEYAVLPKGSINYHVPEDFTLEQGALIEPFSCSLHGVRQADPKEGDTVVLAGAGTLGLGMVQALAGWKYRQLIVLDMIDARLELARGFGADVTLNPGACDAVAEVKKRTGGVGCDVYIEATGHPSAVQQGLDMIRKGGTFVEFSVMSGPSTIDWSIIGDAKELTIRGSQLSPDCYETVIDSLRRGATRTQGVITHRFPLEDWQKAYQIAQTKEALKVVLIP